MKLFLVILLFWFAWVIPAWGTEDVIQHGQYGDWQLFQWADKKECGLSRQVETETFLITFTPPRFLNLIITNPKWVLPLKTVYPAKVYIEHWEWGGDAHVLGEHSLIIGFWTSGFNEAFQKGSYMVIRFASGKAWSISLQDAAAALAGLLLCTKESNANQNPFQ